MVQRLEYVVDLANPRAPTQAQWDELSPEERALVVAALPDIVPLDANPPEGDPHRVAKTSTLDALGRFFRRVGKRVYLSSELAVFYPGEPRFVPDVLAVLDVEARERTKWVVAAESKGLDFVLEVHASGSATKDHEKNVTRYAALRIPEYFLFDRARARLLGYRLPDPEARSYERIVPQEGRLASRTLELDLCLEGTRLRFFHGTAPLEEADELIGRLGSMLDELIAKKEGTERLLEAERAAKEDALRRIAELEDELRCR